MNYEVVRFTVTELEENSYIMHDTDGNALAVDPGGEAHHMLDYLESHNLKLHKILVTHGHADHVGGNVAMREATGAQVGVHVLDAPMLTSSILSGAEFLGWRYAEHRADFTFEDGDKITVGKITFEVLHTPGHSRGLCTFVCHDAGIAFPGDLIMQGSVGRWDLPVGDRLTLLRAIRDKILPLPDHYELYPGHGPMTTVGKEKATNRFIMPIVAGEPLEALFA